MPYQILQEDIRLLKQSEKTNYIRLELLNKLFKTIDKMEGELISDSFTVDADSDIRRTFSLSLIVKDSSFNIGEDTKIWLDKYIKISSGFYNVRTNLISYYPMGTYLFTDTNYKYDTTTNTLTLTCVDLMSKLTGLRNGQLLGLTTTIPQGSNLRQAMIDTITQLGGFEKYNIYDTGKEVPYDLNFSTGATVYQILTTLRDLYAGYEMFFDIDNTFVFQPIPTCKDTEPVLVNSDIFDLVISESVDNSFSDIKNVTEVWGQNISADRYTEDVAISYNIDNMVKKAEIGIVNNQITNIVNDTYFAYSQVPTTNGVINFSGSTSSYIELRDAPFNGVNNFMLEFDFNLSHHNTDCSTIFQCAKFISGQSNNGIVFMVRPDGSGRVYFQDVDNGILFNPNTFQVGVNYDIQIQRINGVVTGKINGVQSGNEIIANMVIDVNSAILGQEEDSYYGSFDSTQSFSGHMTYFRFYTLLDTQRQIYVLNFDTDITLTNYLDIGFKAPSNNLDNAEIQFVNGQNASAVFPLLDEYGVPVVAGTIETDKAYVVRYSNGTIKFLGQNQIYALYKNTNSDSPYSIDKIGEIVQVFSGGDYEKIYSDELALERAKYENWTKTGLKDQTTLEMMTIPWLDVNLKIQYTNKRTKITDYYIIKNISGSIMSGTMTMTMIKYYPLYPDII